jgi:hypothetical protein
MPSVQRSIRVPADLNREIRREMEFRGEQDWSKGAISLLSAGKDHRIMVTHNRNDFLVAKRGRLPSERPPCRPADPDAKAPPRPRESG